MKRLIIVAALALAGCVEPTTATEQVDSAPGVTVNNPSQTRIEVERIGVFRDDMAYSGRRGVYIIRDTKTGTEYIGVSGIGITEEGAHPVGVPGKGGHYVEHEE